MNMLRFFPAPLDACFAPWVAALCLSASMIFAISSVSTALPIAAKLFVLSGW
jgi:hypothetical protein